MYLVTDTGCNSSLGLDCLFEVNQVPPYISHRHLALLAIRSQERKVVWHMTIIYGEILFGIYTYLG